MSLMSNLNFNFVLIYRLSKLKFDNVSSDDLVQFEKIIDFVNIALTLDSIRDLEPLREVNGVSNVWREDIVKSCQISPEDLLSSAITINHYVIVPKVI